MVKSTGACPQLQIPFSCPFVCFVDRLPHHLLNHETHETHERDATRPQAFPPIRLHRVLRASA
jgi:hypothetical protein